ncbi:hypothetical protein GCM10020254_49490 [Streptomyces goshikiensis]
MDREYPGGVGRPSDIWTPIVPAIRQGASADSAVAATGPAAEWLRVDIPVLAVAVTPRTSTVRPMHARVRRGLRIRRRVCGMESAFGVRGSRPGPVCTPWAHPPSAATRPPVEWGRTGNEL